MELFTVGQDGVGLLERQRNRCPGWGCYFPSTISISSAVNPLEIVKKDSKVSGFVRFSLRLSRKPKSVTISGLGEISFAAVWSAPSYHVPGDGESHITYNFVVPACL